jgi:putative transcriptional regulator
MSKTSFTRKRGEPFRFTAEERERLAGLTEIQIEAAASADPDIPPLEDAQLRRMQIAREIKRVREHTGLSQPQFARRYRIGLARLRDFEQARSEPDLLVQVFYRLISEDPKRAQTLIRDVESGLSGSAA